MKRNDGTRREQGFTLLELLITVAVIGVIAGIGVQSALYAFDVARLSRSVANMRQLASSVMQYETANSILPNEGGGLQAASSLVPALGGAAGRVQPKDGWGNDLYYEPIVSGTARTFRVYCYGKDGTPDGSVTGAWVDFYTDTVIESGIFLQSKW